MPCSLRLPGRLEYSSHENCFSRYHSSFLIKFLAQWVSFKSMIQYSFFLFSFWTTSPDYRISVTNQGSNLGPAVKAQSPNPGRPGIHSGRLLLNHLPYGSGARWEHTGLCFLPGDALSAPAPELVLVLGEFLNFRLSAQLFIYALH